MSRSIRMELPSLAKEGWLRPLRKSREASLAGADGVVRSSHRLSEVERTIPFLMFRPIGLTLRAALFKGTGPFTSWRGHPSFAKGGVPFGCFATFQVHCV